MSEVLTTTYLKYLCSAFIISMVSRYDIHGKRLFLRGFLTTDY